MPRSIISAIGLIAGLLAATGQAVTLEECKQAALAGSPTLDILEYRLEAAQEGARQAQAAWYPWVNAAANYARSDNPPQAFMMTLNQRQLNMMDPAFNPNEPADTQNIRMSLGARYRLWDGGRRSTDSRMAGLGVAAQGAQLAAGQNELLFQVISAYYQVLQAKAFVSVQEESAKSLEESLRIAKERLAAGSAVQTDVLNLEVKLAETREDLIRARNNVRLGVAALNAAIGQDLATPDNLVAPGQRTRAPAPPTWNPEDAARRPEYQAAATMVALKQQALSRARREYLPTVNAFGTLDWDSERLSEYENSYMAGVMAEVDLFDGFLRSHGNRKAAADLAAAQAEAEKALLNLKLDLQQAGLRAQEAHERTEVMQKSLESAQEAFRITLERYQKGAADINELLTAQLGLTAIRSRDVAAAYDYEISLANLERARGELQGDSK